MPLLIGEPLVVGGTYRLSPGGENPAGTLTALRKDGATWDLTGATVTLQLKDPSGNVTGPFTATVSSPSGGIAFYDLLTTDLDEAGVWYVKWKVVQGSLSLPSEWIEFRVNA